MAKKRAVGIDLGTTYSAVAWMQESGHTAMIPNAEGDILTPSSVLFDTAEIVVGKQAKKAGPLRPDRYAETVKRDMGNPVYSRPIHGRFLPPEVIQACILRQLKSDAVQALGPDFEAVITVPAFFDELRRQATSAAGEMAGLDVIDIVNEPMAAALAFGEELGYLTKSLTPRERMTVLVYDLGGGTFDVTLVEMQQGDLRTLATDGDVRLGGRDWDQRLADYAAETFIKEHREDPRANPASLQLLLNQAEEAKRTLSARQQTKVRVQHAGSASEVVVTRKLFEDLTADLLQRTNHTTRELLATAGKTWSHVQRILLVGGSTRMPMVAGLLEALSGIKPDHSVHPDEAVARGAAIYAHYFLGLQGDQGPAPTFQVMNVNSHSLGIESTDPVTMRKTNVIVIPRNTALPARVTKAFITKSDGQASVAIHVLEGESSTPTECTSIGRTAITGMPPHLPAGTPIDVTYEYGVNGRLSIRARLRAGLHAVNLELHRNAALTNEHVRQWKLVLGKATGFQSLGTFLEQYSVGTPSAAAYGTPTGPPTATGAGMPIGNPAGNPKLNLAPIPMAPIPTPQMRAANAEAALANDESAIPDENSASPPHEGWLVGHGWLGTAVQLVMTSLASMALGYYILCCLRPEQYNYFNLPVPQWSQSSPPAVEPSEE